MVSFRPRVILIKQCVAGLFLLLDILARPLFTYINPIREFVP
jgi:hypothetical protein